MRARTDRWSAKRSSDGKGNFGYNAATDIYEDLVEAGVIDPTKVVRTALENAASVATLLLTSDALIAEKPKDRGQEVGSRVRFHSVRGTPKNMADSRCINRLSAILFSCERGTAHGHREPQAALGLTCERREGPTGDMTSWLGLAPSESV